MRSMISATRSSAPEWSPATPSARRSGEPTRFTGSRNRHLVAGSDGDPREHGADVPGSEHGDPRQIPRAQNLSTAAKVGEIVSPGLTVSLHSYRHLSSTI